ncbi:MAG: cytochrome c biogenesis protein ResB [Dysgonamonadaceae bacterium]|nr:cytochrome c biogenesis protein ResB [Dysgonamonadaceae bacterium]
MGKSIISSYETTIALLAVFAASMATATFVEKFYGTEAAKTFIYYNPLFFILLILLVINFITATFKNRLFKRGKLGYIVIHSAFIIVLAGAFTSHVSGREGYIHLRNDEITNKMIIHSNKEHSEYLLPFEVELVKFTLKRYPGSQSPSSFESLVRIHDSSKTEERLISMNNVLDWKGYRFFQSSYDTDEQGSILSVNQDIAGRNITYTGYALLIAGFVLCFTGKGSRIRKLIRQV